MKKSRRAFLGLAGGAVLGGVPLAGAIAAASGSESPDATALKAKQWAMVIDMKKCIDRRDCTACSDACHLAHNVPKIEGFKEELMWIWREPFGNAFPSQLHAHTADYLKNGTVTVLCNHCESPACARVCPTGATWKRESDGVVMMDQHRCVGCRYCMAACPYGARSFNWKDPRPFIKEIKQDFPTRTKGVVEKCNFCAERLAFGKGPLCVEACSRIECNALTFGDIGDANSAVAQVLRVSNTIRRKPELGTGPQVYYIV